MDRFKKLLDKLKGFVFGFVLSLLFIGSAVYAWQAVWHGTNWINSGGIIRAKEIAENLEFLKQRIDELENIITSTSAQLPRCAQGQILQQDASGWSCVTLYSKFGSGQRCANDKISFFCGQNPAYPWNYNTCYSYSHAVYYNAYPEWDAVQGGYVIRKWPMNVDVVCDIWN